MNKSEAVEQVNVHQEILLAKMTECRKSMGLTQAELADRVGVSRMTVQRAEGEDADPQLSTFLAMALALNLMPELATTDSELCSPSREDLVHRGYSHVRTRHDLEWSDRKREAALAKSWEGANASSTYGLSPILTTLVPNCTQEQASACATVVQWMGSEVGFDFLQRALEIAGYTISATGKSKKA